MNEHVHPTIASVLNQFFPTPATPTGFQPRYVAYAKMHGKTPEQMIELDQSRGGVGAWFSPWIMGRWAEFDKLTERRYRIGAGHTTDGHGLFDRWLASGCQHHPEETTNEH